MNPRTLAYVAALSAGVAFAAEPTANAPSNAFSGQVEVRLVQVDVWASAHGQPVLDLAQNEFRLLEDGQPVEILYFEQPQVVQQQAEAEAAPAQESAPAGEAAPEAAPEGPPPTLAVFLDDVHLAPAGRERVLHGLVEQLSGESLRGVGLLIVSYDHRLNILLPRTRDLEAAKRALAAAISPGTVAVQIASAERQAIAQIQDRQREAMERSGRGVKHDAPGGDGGSADPSAGFEVPCPNELLRIADDYANTVETEARGTLSALRSFASSLSALPGRKILLFVSDGLPSRPGGVAFDYVRTLCDGSGLRNGVRYAADVTANGGRNAIPGQLSASNLALAGENRTLNAPLREVVSTANAGGVTFWSYGASGLTNTDSDVTTESRTQTPESRARQRGEMEDLLTALAIDSGGRPMLQRNDFTAITTDLVADFARAYSLAYLSPRSGDGRIHSIQLETTRKSVDLRYRGSWRDNSATEELANLIEGALEFGVDHPGLEVGAQLLRAEVPGESAPRIVLRITIPPDSLALFDDKSGKRRGNLRVAIAMRGSDGNTSPIRSKVLPVEFPAGGQAAATPLVQDIAMPNLAADTVIAVGLRDESGGTVRVVRLTIGGPPRG